MSPNAPHFRNGMTGSAITVKVVARAKKSEIAEILKDGTVKIRLATPTISDHGNEVLARFLAEILEITPAQIEIVAGASGPDKLITILGLDSPTVQERIMKHAPHPSR